MATSGESVGASNSNSSEQVEELINKGEEVQTVCSDFVDAVKSFDETAKKLEEVKKLMGKGKVHMICSEYLDAVKCFEEATRKLDEHYGQAADECGEAYFYYGKSLLEVARMERGVLGNALQGALDSDIKENGDETTSEQTIKTENTESSTVEAGPSKVASADSTKDSTDNNTTKNNDKFVGPEPDENEKEKIENDVQDAMTEDAFKEAMLEDQTKKEDKTTSEENDLSNKDEPMLEDTNDTSTKDTTSQTSEVEVSKPSGETNKSESGLEGESKDENIETTEDDNDDEKADDENADDEPMDAQDIEVDDALEQAVEEDEPATYMELAWQMLEVSRIIFKRREKKENLMLAESHLKLGEIQMEQEQFLGAVEDFLKCLDIQKQNLSPDDRLLAETAYNIGLAFSFQAMYDKSKDYYSQALTTIGLRIASLENLIEEAESKSKGKEKAKPDDPLVANKKELQELQELYPEIKAKVDDATDMAKQNKPSISSVMGNGSQTTIGFGSSSSSAAQPVSMISTKKKTPADVSDSQPVTMIATKKKAPVAVSDISHLVHRNKRKPEEAEDDDTVAKKARQDPDATSTSNDNTQATNGNTKVAAADT